MISRKILPGIVFLTFTIAVAGQQHPFYSQYTVDKFLVNPAVAGANGITTVNFLSRQQFVGLENAPRTFALTVQSRLLDESYIMRRLRLRKDHENKSRSGRVGLGASVFNDRNGIVSRTGFQATYAYHIAFENIWQLSMAVSLQGLQYRIDDSGVPVAQQGDPVLAAGRKSLFTPDANVGVFATNGNAYGGITMTDLLGSGIQLSKELYFDYNTQRKYNLVAGYKFDINRLFSVEPSVLLQGTVTSFSMDLGARLFYLENYWAALSYRSNKSMVMMIGGRIERFYLGYSFDLDIGPVRSYSSGSHEIILGIRIGDNDSRRYRWFMQDQRNFDI